MRKMLAVAILLFGVLGTVRASIIVVAPTVSTAGSFTITQDIKFTITTGQGAGAISFVLDEWVTSDGSQNTSNYSPALAIQINSGPVQTYGTSFFRDNFVITSGSLTPNDGNFVVPSLPALAINDTLTVKAATYTISPVSNFNPQCTQTFSGNMFLSGNAGGNPMISTVVAVPEPTSIAFLAAGGLALVARRRRVAA